MANNTKLFDRNNIIKYLEVKNDRILYYWQKLVEIYTPMEDFVLNINTNFLLVYDTKNIGCGRIDATILIQSSP
jgi:hypothetical protein